ncbi:MAG: PAS domain S-box protein [Chlorobi bacterium]|nr:PAS domain S-box protein [Chlorobiota bacterium]
MKSKSNSENESEKLRSQIASLETKLSEADQKISALSNAAEELEQKYLSLLEGSNEAVFIFSLTDDGIDSLLEVNEAACAMFGYKKNELLNLPIKNVCPPKIVRLAEEKRKGILKENDWNSFETVQIIKSGVKIPIEVRFKIFKIAKREIAVSLIKNLSADKETQKVLLHEKEFSKRIIETSALIIVGLDKNHVIRIFNKGAEKTTGFSKREVLGKDWFEIFIPGFIEEDMEKVWRDAWGVKHHSYINPILTKEGEKKIISWQTTGIYDDENEENHLLISLGIDITKNSLMEWKLKKSEENFKNLSNLTFEGILIHKNGIAVDVNYALTKMTGYSREELIGKDLIKLFLLEKYKKIVAEKISAEYTEPYEVEGMKKDGAIFPIELESRNVFIEGKEKLRVTAVRDITVRKKLYQKLHESEKRYRELFEKTEDATLIIEDKKFVLCNEAAVKMLNYKNKDELLNLHPAELSPVFQPDGKNSLIKADEMMRTALEKGSHRFEWLHKRADGYVFPVEVLLTKISTDDGKNILHTVWRDITDRKHAEKELQKLSQAIVQSPVIVFITDMIGDIEYVNPKFTEITGYTLNEVKNKTPRVLKSGYHSNEFYENLWRTLLSGNVWSGEFRNKKKNGELYWESANISPIKNDAGKITHFVAVKEDITEKKKMLDELIASKVKAESANKMKSIFLAQMSHEIRTPINAMLSLSSLLKDDLEDQVDEDTKLSFELIGRAGIRIIRTVDLLLNLSEIQAGTYEPIYERIDIYADILGKIIVNYKKQAKDKGIKIGIEINTNETEILADVYTVEQIFTQLVDNAIKYTNQGEVTIKIYRNNQEQLIVEVSDTGIGIKGEYLTELFEPFSQEEMGYTRKYEGNGIGLALVKSYCDLNKATVEIESVKGKGSTFKVVFLSSQ